MNVLFLLLTAIVLLTMGHRFWGRIVGGFVFPSLRPPGDAESTAPSAGGVALDIAASGGVLSVIGMGLALTWGWAPIYVWILVACALLSTLVGSALAWMCTVTGAEHGIDAMGRVCGEALSRAARLTMAMVLVVWIPLLVLMLAFVVTNYPAAATTLSIQCLIALALSRWIAGQAGAVRAGVILVASVLAVPAGVALARTAPVSAFLGSPPDTVLPLAAMVLLLAGAGAARLRRERLLEPLSVLVSVALVVLLVLAVAAAAVMHPGIGYLGYASAGDRGGALPLVVVCAGVGLLPLLGALGKTTAGDRSFGTAGTMFEGLTAMVLLAALLAAPVVMRGAAVDLPDWRIGIEPGMVTGYAIASLSAMATGLGLEPSLLEEAVASIFAGLLAVPMVVAVGTLRSIVARLASPIEKQRGGADAIVFVAVAAVTVACWRNQALPVDAWLLAGQSSIFLAAISLASAALAAKRLRVDSRVTLVAAATLALLFWWACVERMAGAWIDGYGWSVLAQLPVVLVGAYGTAAVAASFARLSSERRGD